MSSDLLTLGICYVCMYIYIYIGILLAKYIEISSRSPKRSLFETRKNPDTLTELEGTDDDDAVFYLHGRFEHFLVWSPTCRLGHLRQKADVFQKIGQQNTGIPLFLEVSFKTVSYLSCHLSPNLPKGLSLHTKCFSLHVFAVMLNASKNSSLFLCP